MLSKFQPYCRPLLGMLLVLFLLAYYGLASAHWHKLLFYPLLPLLLWQWKMQPLHWRQPAVFALLGYFAFLIVNLLWSPIFSGEELGELLRKMLLTLGFVGAVAIAVASYQEAVFARVLKLSVMLAALSAALSMALINLDVLPMQRLIGFGRALNANQSGTLYGVALVAAYYVFLRAPSKERLITGLCWMVLLVALLLTQSRGALLAAVAAQAVLTLLHPAMTWRKAGIAAAFAVLALWVVSTQVDWHAMLERMDGYRLFIWQDALAQQWSQAPLWGLGYRMPYQVTLPYGETIYQTHSIYVAALYQGGVLGLGALLWMLGAMLRQAWQLRAQVDVPLWLALLVNAVLLGAVDYDILIVNAGLEWLLFWLPIGTVVALGARKG